jgi:hypothetical protein
VLPPPSPLERPVPLRPWHAADTHRSRSPDYLRPTGFCKRSGRVAKALVVETPGVYRSSREIEEIAESMDVIRNTDKMMIFPVVPKGFYDHIEYSFGMARSG